MRILQPVATILLSIGLFCACGDSDDDTEASMTSSPASSGSGSNTISGTVTYTGTDTINKVTISTASTPSGFPIDSYIEYSSPTFPQSFTLTGINDGDFYVFATLDKGDVTTGAPDTADVVITYGTGATTFSSGTSQEDITISAD
jgi:hypothetical protein